MLFSALGNCREVAYPQIITNSPSRSLVFIGLCFLQLEADCDELFLTHAIMQERARGHRQQESSNRTKRGPKAAAGRSFLQTFTGSEFRSRIGSLFIYLLVAGAIVGEIMRSVEHVCTCFD